MTQRRLLAIFAHPDDESFGPGGTLARYVREGAEVHVCTVTDGAAGSHHPEALSDEGAPHSGVSMAWRRREELACACRVLGVELHILDYRDSGMEGMPDNQHPESLYQSDLDVVAEDLVRIIRATRPHVILTHDPTGGYFHPDHIKVNHAVRRAWARTGDAQAYPELVDRDYAPWQPARLYYTALPRSTVKWFVRIVRLLRQNPHRFGQNQDIDLTKAGVPDEKIHVRLDISDYIEVKEQASACHQSQGGGGALRFIPGLIRRPLTRLLMRFEYFTQARPEPHGVLNDLFEEVELDS
jgi:LmbE family N-acetylglucosaminyl deacetylase